MKKMFTLFFALLCSLLLTACTSSQKTEQDIIADIPADFITVTIDDELVSMQADAITIDKRQTDDKSDSIYFYLDMSNEDYQLTAYCYFNYAYYNAEGGWILEYCESCNEEYSLTPLHPNLDDVAESAVCSYYDNYSLTDTNFDDERLQYIYAVSEEYENCTYSSSVDITYTFSSNIWNNNDSEIKNYRVTGNWEENITNDLSVLSCDWNIEGSWNCVPKPGYELSLDISSYITDPGNNTAYIEAITPYNGNAHEGEDRLAYEGIVDISYDYENLDDPILMLSFTIRKDGSAYYRVWIHANYAEVQVDGWPTVNIYRT